MRTRLAYLGCIALLALVGGGASASASGGMTSGVAGLRAAATRFVGAELDGDGATACAVLNPPLDVTVGHRTCAQRWDASLRAMLRTPGARQRLRVDAGAIGSAPVSSRDHGLVLTIKLPTPLLGGRSRFLWTDDCWMLED